MLQYDFEESIGYWLTLSTQAYHRALSEAIAPYGITYRQSQVLGWLVLKKEMSQAQLAAKMMIEPPTLAGILERMERCGWIVRRRCEEDRRKKWIQAAPAAEPVWEKIVECAMGIRSRATEGLSERQQATLKKLLRRVNKNLATRSSAATAKAP